MRRVESALHPSGPFGFVPGDAAKRMSDHLIAAFLADPKGNVGRWMAFRLSDGSTDGIVYDNVRDAADAQLHYKQCAYIRIHTGGVGPRECAVMLAYHRRVYDAGNLPPYLQGVPLRVPNTIDWMFRRGR